MNIIQIQRKVQEGQYRISFTHTEKLRRRKIASEMIEQAISTGELIEAYPADPRGPSCLIFGYTDDGRPLHVVCGNLDEKRLLIITAYGPDHEEWEADWKTRKGGLHS
jgi:hypothetical protein